MTYEKAFGSVSADDVRKNLVNTVAPEPMNKFQLPFTEIFRIGLFG